uniref:Uncharacterized protein n=1 Tax=Triticum urartu TaxID=4572 RepID=A0A8R7TLZ3_TRIUA
MQQVCRLLLAVVVPSNRRSKLPSAGSRLPNSSSSFCSSTAAENPTFGLVAGEQLPRPDRDPRGALLLLLSLPLLLRPPRLTRPLLPRLVDLDLLLPALLATEGRVTSATQRNQATIRDNSWAEVTKRRDQGR